MFNTILIATDLSSASDRVLACMPGMQRLGARQVILMHALGIRRLDVMRYELARLIAPRLEMQRAVLETQGFDTLIEVAPGPPAIEVHRVAAEHNADLIVIGSHGATLAREILLGGVATEILHHATLPVLVFKADLNRPEQGTAACPDPTAHILFPTDFSDTAERAFLYVESLVRAGARDVALLHVQDRARIGKHLAHRLEEFSRIDQVRLDRLRGALESAGAEHITCEITCGSPIQEILRLAGQHPRAFIVMGSQGRGFISEVFLGCVSHQVARHAAHPVLLVPAARPPGGRHAHP